jgi:Family of unknown function (DUF6152)
LWQNTELEAFLMRAKVVILIAAANLFASVPVWAHHSFAAEYDRSKPLKFENAVVTKVEWTNPHARFYVDVKDDKGNVTNWNFELASPNVLKRQGWTRHSLNEGDHVTVVGSAAKDGSHMGNASSVTLADGTRVGARAAADEAK